MTLKEKFLPRMYCFMGSGMLSNTYDENVAEQNAVECEKIADDYAIEFAEWLYKWDNTRLPNGNWIIGLGLKAYTSEEVLVKFKKEKGL